MFLATGKASGHPALAGVMVRRSAPAKTWTVPLSGVPDHSACAFGLKGPISILLTYDDGKTARLSRIDVSEDGQVLSNEHVVRETPNRVLAVVTDMRSRQPVSFMALEADRVRHDRVALVKVPLEGNVQATPMRVLAGWPAVSVNGEVRPDQARQLTIEMGLDGAPWVALTDSRGDLIGGRLSRPLALLRDGKTGGPALFPQLGLIVIGAAISCFSEDGMLHHSVVTGGE